MAFSFDCVRLHVCLQAKRLSAPENSTWEIVRRTFHELACCYKQRAFGGFFDQSRHRLRLRYIDRVAALTSTIIAPARFAICRWASGGIILSSVVSRYQLGFAFHAGSLTVPFSAFTPHGTCESAMNAAFSGLTSPAKNAGNLALSNSK